MSLFGVWEFKFELKKLTAPVLVAKVGKAPDIAQANGVGHTGEDELKLARPLFPLAVLQLLLKLLLHLLRGAADLLGALLQQRRMMSIMSFFIFGEKLCLRVGYLADSLHRVVIGD